MGYIDLLWVVTVTLPTHPMTFLTMLICKGTDVLFQTILSSTYIYATLLRCCKDMHGFFIGYRFA